MSTRAESRPRVLLVHANPFQQVMPVPPYGLERIRTAAADTGAEIEIVDPYLVSDRPLEAAAEAARRLRPAVVGLGVRVVEDCIVVDDSGGADDRPFDLVWFMPELLRLRRAIAEAAPDALFLLGGAAFSAMPRECLDYLDVEHGVVGAGELAFREVLERVAAGSQLDGIPGLVRRGEPDPLASYGLAMNGLTLREPLYAPVNSIPVRTRVGCAMECVYCLTANLRRKHLTGDVDAVAGEIEAVVESAGARGIRSVPIFFADDEFNLPDERYCIALLGALEDRELAPKLRWRGYFNPTPFSDELAALIARTNGHASITVDSAAEAVIARAQKPFRRRHLDALIETLTRHGVSADVGLIFGLPGETDETLAETIAFVRSLPPEIEVGYSAGARVYPNTPLAAIAAAEPQWVVGDGDPTFFAPTAYSSPLPPRELVRELGRAFAGLDHVRPAGVGFGSGRTTMAEAYRAVLGDRGSETWKTALAHAERPGDYQRGTADSLAALAQVAIWNRRFDLAAAAYRRLARQPELPEGVSRGGLRVARLGCSAIALTGRLNRRRRARTPEPAGS